MCWAKDLPRHCGLGARPAALYSGVQLTGPNGKTHKVGDTGTVNCELRDCQHQFSSVFIAIVRIAPEGRSYGHTSGHHGHHLHGHHHPGHHQQSVNSLDDVKERRVRKPPGGGYSWRRGRS